MSGSGPGPEKEESCLAEMEKYKQLQYPGETCYNCKRFGTVDWFGFCEYCSTQPWFGRTWMMAEALEEKEREKLRARAAPPRFFFSQEDHDKWISSNKIEIKIPEPSKIHEVIDLTDE